MNRLFAGMICGSKDGLESTLNLAMLAPLRTESSEDRDMMSTDCDGPADAGGVGVFSLGGSNGAIMNGSSTNNGDLGFHPIHNNNAKYL